MQSEYRAGLVESMLEKKYRAMSMEKIRTDIVHMGAKKQNFMAESMYGVLDAGAKAMQPTTIENYKKEYDLERRRKAKAKLEGGAN